MDDWIIFDPTNRETYPNDTDQIYIVITKTGRLFTSTVAFSLLSLQLEWTLSGFFMGNVLAYKPLNPPAVVKDTILNTTDAATKRSLFYKTYKGD